MTPLRLTPLLLVAYYASLVDQIQQRWRRLRHRNDEGSITVEKAVITAIALALALGLMAVISAVVVKYQNRIE